MHSVLIIVRREFLERVRTKAFIVTTALFPVFILALVFLPALIKTGGGERELVLVSEASEPVTRGVIETLTAPPEDEDGNAYRVEQVAGPLNAVRDELNRRVQAEEIDGYLWLPADVVRENRIEYRARDVSNLRVVGDIGDAVTAVLRAERLRETGLSAAQVGELVRPVDVGSARITDRGEEGAGALATAGVAYILLFLFVQLIVLYGQAAMRSVLEEKNNRIVEVIVSSVRATHLMAGKILGLTAVVLLQVAIWFGFTALLASQGDWLAERFGIPIQALRAIQFEPLAWVALVVFFALGFVLYAAMYAAAGATVSSEQEAQQLAVPMMLPLFIPVVFVVPLLMEPLGATARTLGLIPFTAPVVMPMRIAATDVPPGEIALSIVFLLLGVAAVMWLAGKIYRIGILSTGKKPTLREVMHWLRAA